MNQRPLSTQNMLNIQNLATVWWYTIFKLNTSASKIPIMHVWNWFVSAYVYTERERERNLMSNDTWKRFQSLQPKWVDYILM